MLKRSSRSSIIVTYHEIIKLREDFSFLSLNSNEDVDVDEVA